MSRDKFTREQVYFLAGVWLGTMAGLWLGIIGFGLLF